MDIKKKLLSAALFVALAVLTFYAVFKEQDLNEIASAVANIHKGYLAAGAAVAVFFVAAEGIIIWYLFRVVGEKTPLASCLKYSYTGFFYSGITPSATGGQPMQLYYMAKDGNNVATGSVVLMTVAAAYKFVLVLIGLGISLFWFGGLRQYLGGYIWLYFLGLFLNALLVVGIVAVMLNGAGIERLLCRIAGWLEKIHLLRPSETRKEKIHRVLEKYEETVSFLKKKENGKHLFLVVIFTFIQRFSVFALTWLIYVGFGLEGANILEVMMLQAVIYISVDMLPLPGSQGITEVMYHVVFSPIFIGGYMTASMCVTRSLNFYLLMVLSAIVALYSWWKSKKKAAAQD